MHAIAIKHTQLSLGICRGTHGSRDCRSRVIPGKYASRPWLTLLAIAALASLGCSDERDHGVHPDSAAQAGKAEGSAASSAATSGANSETGASGSGGAQEPGRADPSLRDAGSSNPDASTPDKGEGGRTSTGQGTPINTGTECFGGRADTQRHSAHCGSCGNACAPFVLASGLDWPVGIALNATTAFWITNGNDAQVMSVPLSGGTPTVLAPAQPFPSSIAVDATSIYWAGYGTISKMPLEGGTPVRLVPVQTIISPFAIALDHEFVYWVDQGDSDLGRVMKVALEGGEPITLATIPGSDPFAIAVDKTSVYWANGVNSNDALVLKVGLEGGTPVTLAPGTRSVSGLAVDASGVYWAGHDTVGDAFGATIESFVRKVPLDGGDIITLATGTHMAQGLAIDRAGAYWTNSSTSQVVSAIPGTDGLVLGVPLAGGDTVTLGPDQDEPAAIATNGTTVCWTTTGSGQGNGSVKCLGTCDGGYCR